MSKIGYIGNINAFVDIQTEEILEKLRAYKADIYGIETTSEVKDVDELLLTTTGMVLRYSKKLPHYVGNFLFAE